MNDEFTPAPNPPRSFAWKRVLQASALLFIVGTLIVSYEIYRWNVDTAERLNKEIQRVAEAGQPTSTEELAAYLSSTSSNAVDLSGDWAKIVHQLNMEEATFSAFHYSPFGETPVPSPGEPWQDSATVQAFLDRYDSLLDELDRLNAMRDRRQFRDSEFQGFFDTVENFPACANLSRLLALKARYHAYQNEPKEFVATIRMGFDGCEGLVPPTCWVGFLVPLASHRSIVESIHDSLGQWRLPAGDSSELRQFLLQQDCMLDCRSSFVGERVAIHDLFGSGALGEWAASPVALLPFMLRSNHLCYLEHSREEIEALNLPFPDALQVLNEIAEKLESTVESASLLDDKLGGLARSLTSSGARILNAAGRQTVQVRACATALGVEQFRAENGRLPLRLTELVPRYLGSIPLDPYAGLPLNYVVRGDSYTIYSIGTDFKDNGGVRAESQEYDSEILFEVPRPADE